MSSDDEWQYTTMTFPECPKHPGVYHKMTGECEVYAAGERAATQQIVQWLRDLADTHKDDTGSPIPYDAISYEDAAERIERGEHKTGEQA